MMRFLNQREVGEFFGVSDTTVQTWQAEGMPVHVRGERGMPHQFDSAAIHAWLLDRAVARERRDRPRDRLDRANAELRELDLQKRRGELIELEPVVATWGNLFAISRTRLLAIADGADVPEGFRSALRDRIAEALQDLAAHDPETFVSATR